jgi:hypothetical protein
MSRMEITPITPITPADGDHGKRNANLSVENFHSAAVRGMHLENVTMPRNRQRATLEAGQRLDINKLMRDGAIRTNGAAAGTLRASYPDGFEQTIEFVSRPRHFGGRQFYFRCPITGRLASVLWKPPGATRFASRHAWPHQVSYQTAQADRTTRCHLAKAKIRRRLGDVDELDDLPPRPKRMREATYRKWEARYDEQQKKLDDALMLVWRSQWALLKPLV